MDGHSYILYGHMAHVWTLFFIFCMDIEHMYGHSDMLYKHIAHVWTLCCRRCPYQLVSIPTIPIGVHTNWCPYQLICVHTNYPEGVHTNLFIYKLFDVHT